MGIDEKIKKTLRENGIVEFDNDKNEIPDCCQNCGEPPEINAGTGNPICYCENGYKK